MYKRGINQMERIIISIAAVIFIAIIIFIEYLRQKKCLSSVKDDILVILPSSPAYFYLGIMGMIVFAIPTVIFLINLDKETIIGFAVFYCFALLCVYLCIYGLFGKCVITTDSLIVYMPLIPVKKIRADEITSVKYSKNRTGPTGTERKVLKIYHQHKKICSIEDDDIQGFDLLYYLFEQSGKIERIPIEENITVTARKSETVCGVIGLLFFLVLWLYMIWNKNEFELFYHILIIVVILVTLIEMMHILLWRVTMDAHTISVRNSFGTVKTYEISQITKVAKKDDDIILYTGEKEIVKIPKKAKNADYLAVRLGSIPHLSYPSDR